MESAKTRNWSLWVVAALLALGFTLDVLGYLDPVRGLMHTLIRPVQLMFTSVAAEVKDVTQQRESLVQLQADNIHLQEEANRLLIENIQLRELERENQQLRELLNYTQNNTGFDYTTAAVVGRIIGSDPSNLLYTIIVDAGAKDGVARDMPVINSRGLVGRVTRVGTNWAQVLLVIDPASSINVVVQNTRVEGVVRGQLGGTLIMERIPQGVTISPGDLVLTSGIGGNLPNKLVVGQVTEVFQRDLDLFQTAHVRATVDFGDLETVLILTAFTPIEFEQDLFDNQEELN